MILANTTFHLSTFTFHLSYVRRRQDSCGAGRLEFAGYPARGVEVAARFLSAVGLLRVRHAVCPLRLLVELAVGDGELQPLVYAIRLEQKAR